MVNEYLSLHRLGYGQILILATVHHEILRLNWQRTCHANIRRAPHGLLNVMQFHGHDDTVREPTNPAIGFQTKQKYTKKHLFKL